MSLNFWKPSEAKVKPIFTPVKIFNKANTKSISKKNLTWPQAQVRYPRMKPFGDADRDGKLNMFDCKPFDKTKHGWAHQGVRFSRERSTHIKMMSPEKFLRTTYREAARKLQLNPKGVKVSSKDYSNSFPNTYKDYAQYKKPMPVGNWRDEENVQEIKKLMKDKEVKIEIPFIEYDQQGRPTTHEGRHRAVAAKQLGIKLIPVTVARELREARDWKRIRSGELGNRPAKVTKKDWRNNLENVKEVISIKSADIPLKEQKAYGKERAEALKGLVTNSKEVFEHQDANQERTIHSSGWNGGNFQHVLEGSGDILRETAFHDSGFVSKGYIKEKIDRIKRHIEQEEKGWGKYNKIDSYEESKRNNPMKFKKLKEQWKEQPVITPLQAKAKKLNLQLLDKDFSGAKQTINDIEEKINQPSLPEEVYDLPDVEIKDED